MICKVNSMQLVLDATKSWHKMIASIVLLVLLAETAESCRGGRLIGTGVTLADKKQILDVHNRLRSQVAQGQVPNQPGAQNMQEMVWDDELAATAQQWAQQCQFDHDPGRYLDRFIMGQNLGIIWSTAPLEEDEGDFQTRIQTWFNEVKKYAWGARWSPATGHYSQLVWGESNLIGCGFAYYQDSRRYNKLYVCNYGPGGNVQGSMPYEVGTPACQNHGMYPSSTYSGLCVSTRAYYTPQNNLITQNTYTFKSERVNPVKYQTYKTSSRTSASSSSSSYQTQQQRSAQTSPNNLALAYQRALANYNAPHATYDEAIQSYQLVLEAYNAAYSTPKQTNYHSRSPTKSSYNWGARYGK